MGARFRIAFIMAAIASPALAAGVLPFEGAFGDETGCSFYLEGTPPAGKYALLTPDTFASDTLGCDFGEMVSRTATVFTVFATCSPGGPMTVSVFDRGTEGYLVEARQTEAGPLRACPALPTGDGVVQL